MINCWSISWSTNVDKLLLNMLMFREMLLNCYSFWSELLKTNDQLLIKMLIGYRREINKLINCWSTSWAVDLKLLNSWSPSWILEGTVTQQLFNMLIFHVLNMVVGNLYVKWCRIQLSFLQNEGIRIQTVPNSMKKYIIQTKCPVQ